MQGRLYAADWYTNVPSRFTILEVIESASSCLSIFTGRMVYSIVVASFSRARTSGSEGGSERGSVWSGAGVVDGARVTALAAGASAAHGVFRRFRAAATGADVAAAGAVVASTRERALLATAAVGSAINKHKAKISDAKKCDRGFRTKNHTRSIDDFCSSIYEKSYAQLSLPTVQIVRVT